MCWSDCADAQADLQLCCLHNYAISRFFQDEAQIVINYVFSPSNECYLNVFYMHVSILIEGFNANKTYKISVLFPSENQTSYLYPYVWYCPVTIMHHVFTFQLRYTDILLSKLVGLNNNDETRCILRERSLILVRTVCEWSYSTIIYVTKAPHVYIIVNLGFSGMYIMFLISALNIDNNGYSLELPRWCAMIKNWCKDPHNESSCGHGTKAVI